MEQIALDQDGEILVWAGEGSATVQRASAPARLDAARSGAPADPRRHRCHATFARSTSGGRSPGTLPAVEPAGLASVASDAERRQLTVMFCDLVDSTALSTRLDPEDLHDVIRAYQEPVHGASSGDYDGFVAKYMGDGILVYFGYPKRSERNAERAVRSGLAIVEAMAELNADARARQGDRDRGADRHRHRHR